VKEEGIRRKEEGGIYRDPHLAGEEQSINQPDSQTWIFPQFCCVCWFCPSLWLISAFLGYTGDLT